MENWADKVLVDMQERLTGTKVQDLRFFRIDELRRNIKRIDEYSASCSECSRFKSDIDASLHYMHEAVYNPGKSRRKLDHLVGQVAKHMKKEHQVYPPWYFNYNYSLYGIIVGGLLGVILFLVFPTKSWETIGGGFFAGLLIGQIIGGKKDRKVREENRLM